MLFSRVIWAVLLPMLKGVELNLPAGKTTDFDLTEVANLFVELEFNTIFNRIPGAPEDKSPAGYSHRSTRRPRRTHSPRRHYHTVDTVEALAELVNKLKQSQPPVR
jgi:hypothetical protein